LAVGNEETAIATGASVNHLEITEGRSFPLDRSRQHLSYRGM
jgi:hypothetical protein